MDPTKSDDTAEKIRTGCKSEKIPTKGPLSKIINTLTVANLGTIAKNAVTIVGEPSYTSGAQL